MAVRVLTRLCDEENKTIMDATPALRARLLQDVPDTRTLSKEACPLPGLLQKNASERATLRTSSIALSLAADLREGKTPDLSLKQFPEALRTDPFGGKPLKVVLHPDRLLVYSVAENLVDDGGMLEDWEGYRQGQFDDWAFLVKLQPDRKP